MRFGCHHRLAAESLNRVSDPFIVTGDQKIIKQSCPVRPFPDMLDPIGLPKISASTFPSSLLEAYRAGITPITSINDLPRRVVFDLPQSSVGNGGTQFTHDYPGGEIGDKRGLRLARAAAKARVKAEITVSPAPETSHDFLSHRRNTVPPAVCSKSVMPCSPE